MDEAEEMSTVVNSRKRRLSTSKLQVENHVPEKKVCFAMLNQEMLAGNSCTKDNNPSGSSEISCTPGQQGENDGSEESMSDEEFDNFDDLLSDDSDFGQSGDEEDEGGEAKVGGVSGEDKQLEEPCIKQAILLTEKLVNNSDNVSFTELTAMLCDGEDTEADPSISEGPVLDQVETVVENATNDPGVATRDRVDESKSVSAAAKATRQMQSMDNFEKELNEQQRMHLRRGSAGRGGGTRGRGGRGARLHPTLSALMGQANLCLSHNRTDEAIKMCLEIIRQFPNSPLPYETLALIFESRDQKKTSLQFQLMAAFLSPQPEKWIDLAEFYEQQDEPEQAVYCYSRAIKLCPTTLPYHRKRLDLLEQLGSNSRAAKCYVYMLKFVPSDQAEGALEVAKGIAKHQISEQNYVGARQALETIFSRHPRHVTYDDVSLLLDVLTTIEDYTSCVQVLTAHAAVQLIHPEDTDSTEYQSLQFNDKLLQARECRPPDDLPSELRSRLTVSLVRLNHFSLAQPLLDKLMSECTEKNGDFFIAAIEACLIADQPNNALSLVERLLESQSHLSSPTVWRLYGESLIASNSDIDKAVHAYYKVVELAPDNAAVRLSLAKLLLDKRQTNAALDVLTEPKEPYHSEVLLRKCELLLEEGRENSFVESVSLLFSRHFIHIRSRDEVEVLINNKKAVYRSQLLRELRHTRGDMVEDLLPSHTGPDLPIDTQWRLFVRACKILYAQKRYAVLERLTYSALGSREFMKEHMYEVQFYCLQASMANGNSYFAFNLVREIVVRYPHTPSVWNLLNQVIINADDFRHNRFLLRLSQKYPENLALSMLNGHNCLVAGTYKYSLAEYMKVFKGRQDDPLASLMLGLTYVHMACQKFSADKNTLVTQAWVFLNSYRELRGDCQESLYNIGRAMHQLNVLHQAIYYYELALQCPVPESRPDEPNFDLTSTIAFNLSLLYRKGSEKMSRFYIQKYITI